MLSRTPGRTDSAQQVVQLLAYPIRVDVERDQCGYLLVEQSEQKMFGAYVLVLPLLSVCHRQLQALLGGRGEGKVGARLVDTTVELLADDVEGYADATEGGGRVPVADPQQAEQDVFGADVRVVQPSSFLLGEDDSAP